MLAPRRFFPSIGMLLALEAVERLGNVTAASRELSLTQGAVSRQIQNLEDQLGVALFMREKKRIHPTLAGSSYAREIRSSLKQIAAASLKLKANPEGGTLNLAILPAFGTYWLAPRLADFLSHNTGVTINLSTELVPFDFEARGVDAAIHYGQPDWPEAEHLKILDEEVVPACSPELLETVEINSAADLLKLPLLHLETRPGAWEQWLHQLEVEPPPLTGMLFDQFAMMSQATTYGLGVALLPKFLIENELADGRLVSAFEGPRSSLGSYYLVWPKARSDYAPLNRFKGWLKSEISKASAKS